MIRLLLTSDVRFDNYREFAEMRPDGITTRLYTMGESIKRTIDQTEAETIMFLGNTLNRARGMESALCNYIHNWFESISLNREVIVLEGKSDVVIEGRRRVSFLKSILPEKVRYIDQPCMADYGNGIHLWFYPYGSQFKIEWDKDEHINVALIPGAIGSRDAIFETTEIHNPIPHDFDDRGNGGMVKVIVDGTGKRPFIDLVSVTFPKFIIISVNEETGIDEALKEIEAGNYVWMKGTKKFRQSEAFKRLSGYKRRFRFTEEIPADLEEGRLKKPEEVVLQKVAEKHPDLKEITEGYIEKLGRPE